MWSLDQSTTLLLYWQHICTIWTQWERLGHRLRYWDCWEWGIHWTLIFKVQTAVDALLDVVAHIPSLTVKAIHAPGAATDQQQMDNLIMQLRTYAQICQTDTSKSKGSNQYVKMLKGCKGKNRSFPSGRKGKRRDHTGILDLLTTHQISQQRWHQRTEIVVRITWTLGHVGLVHHANSTMAIALYLSTQLKLMYDQLYSNSILYGNSECLICHTGNIEINDGKHEPNEYAWEWV